MSSSHGDNHDGFLAVPVPEACCVYVDLELVNGSSPDDDENDEGPGVVQAASSAHTAPPVVLAVPSQSTTKPRPGVVPGRPVKPIPANKSNGHAGIAGFDPIAAKASGLTDDQVWSIQRLQYRLRALVKSLRWDIGNQCQVRDNPATCSSRETRAILLAAAAKDTVLTYVIFPQVPDLDGLDIRTAKQICTKFGKIRGHGNSMSYSKVVFMEKEDPILHNLFQGCTQEAAIVVGAEEVDFQAIWDMPARHDLNKGKGNYIVPIMYPDGNGGITTAIYGGAAFGGEGLIGRWARSTGSHWGNAHSTTSQVSGCKELYEALRQPGADYRFKTIFSWDRELSGPEKVYRQLGEGLEVLLLDTLSETSHTHTLRSRDFHERIRAKANEFIMDWDAKGDLDFKIGALPSRPADYGCNNAHPLTQGAVGIFQASTLSCAHCGQLEKDQGFRINEYCRWNVPGKGPLCIECNFLGCPPVPVAPARMAPLTVSKNMLLSAPARAQLAPVAITSNPYHWQYSPAVPKHLAKIIMNLGLYRMFICDTLTCHNCGGQPSFLPGGTKFRLSIRDGKPQCRICRDHVVSARVGKFFDITSEQIKALVDQRSTALQPRNELVDIDEWYRRHPGVHHGHARCYECKLPEEQRGDFCIREIGFESSRFEPYCPNCPMPQKRKAAAPTYKNVPLSQGGFLSWVLQPGQYHQGLRVGHRVSSPRCNWCDLPEWVAKMVALVLSWDSGSQHWACGAHGCQNHVDDLYSRYAYFPDENPAVAEAPTTLDDWLDKEDCGIDDVACRKCGCSGMINALQLEPVSRAPMCSDCMDTALVISPPDGQRRCVDCNKPNWVHMLQFDGLQLASGTDRPKCSPDGCTDGAKSWDSVPDHEPAAPYPTPAEWLSSHPEWAGDNRNCGLCADPCPERQQSGKFSTKKVFYNPLADLPLCQSCNAAVPCPNAGLIKAVRQRARGPQGPRRRPLDTLPENIPLGVSRPSGPDDDLDEDSDDQPLLPKMARLKAKRLADTSAQPGRLRKVSKITNATRVMMEEGDDELTSEAKAVAQNLPKFWNQGHQTIEDRKQRQFDAFLDTFQVRQIVRNPNPSTEVIGNNGKSHWTEAGLKRIFSDPSDAEFRKFVANRCIFYSKTFPRGLRYKDDGGPDYDPDEFANKPHPAIAPGFTVHTTEYREPFKIPLEE